MQLCHGMPEHEVLSIFPGYIAEYILGTLYKGSDNILRRSVPPTRKPMKEF